MYSIKALSLIITVVLIVKPTSAAPLDTEAATPPVSHLDSQPSTTTQVSGTEIAITTELPEFTSNKDTTTFSCQGRVTGYYADVKLGCRVYHFCTSLDDVTGGSNSQRMSYMCLEGSLFDQKDLSCVKESDLKVSCAEAEAEYERSNKQFDPKEERPSLSDNLTANILMNPITRFIAG